MCGLAAAVKVLVEKTATPAPLIVACPMDVLPSSKVTVPVARVPVLLIVAVKLTLTS